MNFTRIIGQNNKIYRKLGDYCIAECKNKCYIVCCCCQEVHQTEDNFWHHIHDVHNFELPATKLHMLDEAKHEQQTENQPPVNKRIKLEQSTNSPLYVDTEYLEQQNVDINAPELFNGLSPCTAPDEEDSQSASDATKSTQILNLEHEIKAHTTPRKIIDVARISSKKLLNDRVLKKVLLQMQRTNIEFKYKLDQLSNAINVLERELHDENSLPRKKYMKIIPDKPLTTRDDVLILDEELRSSKEMRNSLHDEALMVITQSPDVYCRVLWRFIMTDEISNQFCWRGVIDNERITKFPIKDMMMFEIFQGAFREKFPSLPLNLFKEKTVTYFNKANERIKKLSKMKNDEAIDENPEDPMAQ